MAAQTEFAQGEGALWETRVRLVQFDLSQPTMQVAQGNPRRWAIQFVDSSGSVSVFLSAATAESNQWIIPTEGGVLYKETDQPGLPGREWFGHDGGVAAFFYVVETILVKKGGVSSAGKIFKSPERQTQQKPQSTSRQPQPLSSRMRSLARRLSLDRR